jgi:hypothetical protein
MGNDARVAQEIGAASKRFAVAEFTSDEIAQVAKSCVEIEAAHGQLQTNINQQFDKILRQLGSEYLAREGARS